MKQANDVKLPPFSALAQKRGTVSNYTTFSGVSQGCGAYFEFWVPEALTFRGSQGSRLTFQLASPVASNRFDTLANTNFH